LKKLVSNFLFLNLLFCFSTLSFSALPIESDDRYIVRSIEITGLKKTSPQVILTEISLKEGAEFNKTYLNDSLRRIENLLIFSKVEAEVDTEAHQQGNFVDIRFDVEEKWTFIPIFKFSGGGGVQSLMVGAYDVNTFGHFLELGAQYESLDGRHSGVFWMRKPQFFSRANRLGTDVWQIENTIPFFAQDGTLLEESFLQRQGVNLFFDHEIHEQFLVGIGAEYFHDDLMAEPSTALRKTEKSKSLRPRLYTRLGKLNYMNYLVEGIQFESELKGIVRPNSTDFQISGVLKGFYLLTNTDNIGLRLFGGTSTSSFLPDFFQAGGLSEVRGYQNARFQGGDLLYYNLEYRKIAFKRNYFLIQTVGFFDQGYTRRPPLTELPSSQLFHSGGFGFRLIFPKVYRLNIRLDFALFSNQKNGTPFSFGLQQVF
jgi:outer membrane protein assembly factor BamA